MCGTGGGTAAACVAASCMVMMTALTNCPLTGCPNAGVATDSEICSQAGRKIMEDHGGNAVDAAIAALLCVGVTNLHSTGLGGGGFMLIYSSSTKTATALDFREISPKQFNFDGYEKRGRPTCKRI